MEFNLLDPREQLVAIMNRIYHMGMTTLSGGNLSIKDANGDLWITPAGIDKGTLTAKDIICVKTSGAVEGPHRPSSEYPFHQAIYAQRPDLKAIVHAHPPALVSFSIAHQVPDTRITPQTRRICGPVGYAPYELTGSARLGAVIAATFADGYNTVLLENHGVVTGGPTLLEAFQRLETLDFCARTLLRARGMGSVAVLTDLQESPAVPSLPEFVPECHSSRERDLRKQLTDIVRRAYDRQLLTSTQGTASARVDETSFLITPTGQDRRQLEIENIVLIRDGQREHGKVPSQATDLHRAIYAQHPAVQAIMTAQAPHVTAFAISAAVFDTKTIPESYIMLRQVPVLPHDTDTDRIAACLSPRVPVLLIQNEGVLTVGGSLLQAFDRLEVAEYSARALIETGSIGKLVPINDEAIHELDIAFALP